MRRSVSERRLCGLWPMMRHKAVLERYAALLCLWHEIHSPCVARRPVRACFATLVRVSAGREALSIMMGADWSGRALVGTWERPISA
eukprot:5891400-Prymnesium_polylepis.1